MTIQYKPQIGDRILPDGWAYHTELKPGIEYVDDSFPGCQFRINSNRYIDVKYSINISITGRVIHHTPMGSKKVRCSIEFVKDGELNVYHKGYLFF